MNKQYSTDLILNSIFDIMKYNTSQIILKHNLNSESRQQKKVFNRMFFCDYMVNNLGVQVEKIGLLINRHHSQVLYNVKQHQVLLNDKKYKSDTAELKQDLMTLTRIGKL